MHRRVFLVRHCQSEANRDQRAETHGDSPLTELGREQARRRAEALAAHGLTDVTVIASPLQRAAHTARAIAAHNAWEVAHDHRLVEGDFGRLENLSYAEIMALVPDGATWIDAADHEGESEETVSARMYAALIEALETASGPVVIVSHGYAISALLTRLGQPTQGIGNGDMVELHFDSEATLRHVAHHPLEG